MIKEIKEAKYNLYNLIGTYLDFKLQTTENEPCKLCNDSVMRYVRMCDLVQGEFKLPFYVSDTDTCARWNSALTEREQNENEN